MKTPKSNQSPSEDSTDFPMELKNYINITEDFDLFKNFETNPGQSPQTFFPNDNLPNAKNMKSLQKMLIHTNLEQIIEEDSMMADFDQFETGKNSTNRVNKTRERESPKQILTEDKDHNNVIRRKTLEETEEEKRLHVTIPKMNKLLQNIQINDIKTENNVNKPHLSQLKAPNLTKQNKLMNPLDLKNQLSCDRMFKKSQKFIKIHPLQNSSSKNTVTRQVLTYSHYQDLNRTKINCKKSKKESNFLMLNKNTKTKGLNTCVSNSTSGLKVSFGKMNQTNESSNLNQTDFESNLHEESSCLQTDTDILKTITNQCVYAKNMEIMTLASTLQFQNSSKSFDGCKSKAFIYQNSYSRSPLNSIQKYSNAEKTNKRKQNITKIQKELSLKITTPKFDKNADFFIKIPDFNSNIDNKVHKNSQLQKSQKITKPQPVTPVTPVCKSPCLKLNQLELPKQMILNSTTKFNRTHQSPNTQKFFQLKNMNGSFVQNDENQPDVSNSTAFTKDSMVVTFYPADYCRINFDQNAWFGKLSKSPKSYVFQKKHVNENNGTVFKQNTSQFSGLFRNK